MQPKADEIDHLKEIARGLEYCATRVCHCFWKFEGSFEGVSCAICNVGLYHSCFGFSFGIAHRR